MRGLTLAVAIVWGCLVGLILYELMPYIPVLQQAGNTIRHFGG